MKQIPLPDGHQEITKKSLTVRSPLWLDGAVLQRDMPLPLWGCAPVGSHVSVEFGSHRWSIGADAQGNWRLEIGPLSPGGPYHLTVACGEEIVILRDLLVGDVWFCAGQSNMEFPLRDAEDAADALADADNFSLRLAQVPVRVADVPQATVTGTCWKSSNAQSAAEFSAVAYYFGQHLQRQLGLPIGLVQATRGATPAEAWMSHAAVASDVDFAPILQRRQYSLSIFPDAAGVVAAAFSEWDAATDAAEREGRPLPGPQPKLVGPGHPWTPGGLYNAMIAPLAAFPIRGVVWYQGAAAPERAFQYCKLFRALIRDWRDSRGCDSPFLFVQEAAFGPRRDQPAENSWAELREAQQMALAEPNTAMVVALDCGDATDIHPPRKRPIGERLGLAARETVYGEPINGLSPLFRSMTIEGNRVRIQLDNTYGALRTLDGVPPRGFTVSAGSGDFSKGHRGFVWAQARIEGDEVVVWSNAVPRPVAVRYAWAQNPDANLCNVVGLPCAPFRSDDYPGITVDVR